MIDLDAMLDVLLFESKASWHDYVVINGTRHDVRTWVAGDPEDPPGGTQAGQHPPPYSTSVRAAWDVIETLRLAGWYFAVSDQRHGCYRETVDGPPFRGFWVWVSHHTEGDEFPVAYDDLNGGAETWPLAVCEAALRCLEAGVF